MIFLVLLLAIMYLYRNPRTIEPGLNGDEQVDSLQNKIEKLQRSQDSIVAVNMLYEDSLAASVKRDSVIGNRIENRKPYIDNFDRRKDEISVHFDSISNDQLFEFFTGIETPDSLR